MVSASSAELDLLRNFVHELASTPVPASVCNPYTGAGAVTQRSNLALYLERMLQRRPSIILVGEAPGYRGGRITGIPFTSEAILSAEPSPFDLFGRSAGFCLAEEANDPCREATATIVWEVLVELGALPLLWNAYPFHPHQVQQPATNRAPKRAELAAGERSLRVLLTRFPIETVIAVGNIAAGALALWGIPAQGVRHPGHGGKAAFRRELARALAIHLMT